MNRIPAWAGAIALSCMILLLGAWGGRMAFGLSENERGLAIVREMNADINARLRSVEERIRELSTEVRRLVIELERNRRELEERHE